MSVFEPPPFKKKCKQTHRFGHIGWLDVFFCQWFRTIETQKAVQVRRRRRQMASGSSKALTSRWCVVVSCAQGASWSGWCLKCEYFLLIAILAYLLHMPNLCDYNLLSTSMSVHPNDIASVLGVHFFFLMPCCRKVGLVVACLLGWPFFWLISHTGHGQVISYQGSVAVEYVSWMNLGMNLGVNMFIWTFQYIRKHYTSRRFEALEISTQRKMMREEGRMKPTAEQGLNTLDWITPNGFPFRLKAKTC